MKKQRKKLTSEGVTTKLKIWREVQEIAPALARYGAIEGVGWKASGGTAITANNTQGKFYTRLLEDAAGRGEALILEYCFDDQTVAINLCLLRDGVLVVLKTTYDESVSKALSPAFLLREDELKMIFSEGKIKRIEYYGKIMDWHTKLTDLRRSIYHLTVFRWAFVCRLAARRRIAVVQRNGSDGEKQVVSLSPQQES